MAIMANFILHTNNVNDIFIQDNSDIKCQISNRLYQIIIKKGKKNENFT